MNKTLAQTDFSVLEQQTKWLDIAEDLALDAHYDAVRKKLSIQLKSGIELAIPVSLIEGLCDATDEQRADLLLTASGRGLHWDAIDVQLSVQGLLKGLYGSPLWMERSTAAAAMGRKGGKSRTAAKTLAARKNGAKGGRPKSNLPKKEKMPA